MGRKLAMAKGGCTAIDRGSNGIYLDVHKSTQAPPACVRISRSSDGFSPGWHTRQSDRCNGGVFPAILNLPLLDSFVPSSHRLGHRRYPRRAFAMISCAPSGD
ncbi:hypothetical protein quinque_009695 [Culex quinquefasciatus]